jgi:hypothetical protein
VRRAHHAEENGAVLKTHFGLRLSEAPRLWLRVWEQHQHWVQEQADAGA